MLSFPKSTEVNKFLAKESIIDNLTLSPALKTSLKEQVKKVSITHELSQKSLNLETGANIYTIFVIKIILKQQDINYNFLEAFAKQHPNNLIFILHFESKAQLAVFYNKLYNTPWINDTELNLHIDSTNLDELWDSLVRQIALNKDEASPNKTDSLFEQLQEQDKRTKLEKEIANLEQKARKEAQPKKKFELVGKIAELKRKLRN